ncbi:MAG: S8 family serine peptidase, partial [Chloroflexi bacterium]|nr:S8 family serine peptidase [Chloroflexota bacterium]
ILQAIEMAVLDGADVILAAWSSAPTRIPLAMPEREALEAAMDAGAIVIAGAGNEGPGYASASRLPGGLERVITVGAQGQPYGRALFGAEVTAPLGPLPLRDVRDVAGDGSPYACAPLPDASLTGKAALISRGQCPFATKTYYAQQAGAALAVIVNTKDEAIEMACVGDYCDPGVITIPAVSVPSSLGESLRAWIAGSPLDAATLRLDPVGRVASFTPQWVAPFSARGPAFAHLLKPDLIAPGQSVVAASPGGGYEALSGTSVAAAHVAGAAALLRQAHPSWGHGEVKAALMASA